jgi:protein O-mannosyl-transferase
MFFYCANSVLLLLFLNSMTGAFWRSAIVAALFALHPLRVESVAWIAERKDVLSGFFFMLTLWFYVIHAKKQTVGGNAKFQKIIFTGSFGFVSSWGFCPNRCS